MHDLEVPRRVPTAPVVEAAPIVEAPVVEATPPAAPKPEALAEARMLRDLQKREAEALQERKQRESLEARLKQLEEMDDLEKIGGPEGYRKLTEKWVKGELKDKVKSPEEEKLSAHDAVLKELKDKIDSYERKEQEALAKVEVEEEINIMKGELDKMAETYALASSFPNTPAIARNRFYQAVEAGKDPESIDLGELFASVEADIARDMSSLVASPRAVKHLLNTNAEFKKLVLEALGKTEAPVAEEKPSLLTRNAPPKALSATAATTVPSRGTRKLNDNDRKARAAVALQRLIESGDVG